jgi:hypothetical protein
MFERIRFFQYKAGDDLFDEEYHHRYHGGVLWRVPTLDTWPQEPPFLSWIHNLWCNPRDGFCADDRPIVQEEKVVPVADLLGLDVQDIYSELRSLNSSYFSTGSTASSC